MSEIEQLMIQIRDFAYRRNWEHFHTPKNLAMAITGEAGELAAEFQWLTPEESNSVKNEKLKQIELEVADVGIYLLRLCDVLKINLQNAIIEKLKINEGRFPIHNNSMKED